MSKSVFCLSDNEFQTETIVRQLKDEAKRYEGKIKEGNVLTSVHSENSNEVTRAKDIFERNGAHDNSYTDEKGVSKQEEGRV